MGEKFLISKLSIFYFENGLILTSEFQNYFF